MKKLNSVQFKHSNKANLHWSLVIGTTVLHNSYPLCNMNRLANLQVSPEDLADLQLASSPDQWDQSPRRKMLLQRSDSPAELHPPTHQTLPYPASTSKSPAWSWQAYPNSHWARDTDTWDWLWLPPAGGTAGWKTSRILRTGAFQDNSNYSAQAGRNLES